MSKLYVRVDDRLIHGQIVASWCITLGIGQIIAIDDELASNEMLQSIMTMGVPAQYDPQIVTVEQAKEMLQKDSGKNRLVIVRSAKELAKIQDEIKGCEVINIGNSSKRDDTHFRVARGVGWYIFLSEEDKEALEALAADGVTIISQQLPTEKLLDWNAIQKSFD